MTRRIALLCLATSLSCSIYGEQMIRVGIYTAYTVQAVEVTMDTAGGYVIYADRNLISDDRSSGLIRLDYRDGEVRLSINGVITGHYRTIEILSDKWDAFLQTKCRQPELASRSYHGDLVVTAQHGKLSLINELLMEHYLAGVVEGEAGLNKELEFYKAQSIIARTYALSNRSRHAAGGFAMCDQVHCQVYHKRSQYMDILEAAFETVGIVVVDADIELITASYHSNCGGQTVNSEDVWTKSVPYLRSKTDTFCIYMPHANWQTTIKTNRWLDYLHQNFSYPHNGDTMQFYCAVDYQPDTRELYFSDDEFKVSLERVRKDWKLNSTYFSVTEQRDSILLEGKGYGHGVGLCQEGAIRMAEMGLEYKDILHYYYSEVHLVQLDIIDFFRE